jgi:hypothetical protein
MNPRDPLSSLLSTWRPATPPANDFAAGVWTRIRSNPDAASPRVIRFSLNIPLPLAAGFAVLFASLAGTGAALAIDRTRDNDRMAAAYVRSIDPLQMMADGPHSHP